MYIYILKKNNIYIYIYIYVYINTYVILIIRRTPKLGELEYTYTSHVSYSHIWYLISGGWEGEDFYPHRQTLLIVR